MPRKSVAELSMPALGGARLPPPKDLKGPARAVWLEVVDAMPAGYFAPIDSTILRSYCDVTARVRQASAKMAGGVVAKRELSPWLKVFNQSVGVQAILARQLRIAKSARGTTSKAKAAQEAEKAPIAAARRPWDDDGEVLKQHRRKAPEQRDSWQN